MAIKAGTANPEQIGLAMLEKLADIDPRSISAEIAQTILQLSFDRSHQERMHVLSAKARQGTLTPAEHDELDHYLHVGDLLAILQAKARLVLEHAGTSP